MSVPTYVLDTNILIANPTAIIRFKANNLFIPSIVVEELSDIEKKSMGKAKENTRRALQYILQIITGKTQEEIEKGIPISLLSRTVFNKFTPTEEPTGLIFFQTRPTGDVPTIFSKETNDNEILAVAVKLKRKGRDVVIITNDKSVQIKAALQGISSEPFVKETPAQKKERRKHPRSHTSRRYHSRWSNH
ncbi:MAG: PIN domain-containing protein [Candidatus Parcubacteria bacterium]|nr:PIN domain-containing protein [Candidatus Parcubacteria bacterium]